MKSELENYKLIQLLADKDVDTLRHKNQLYGASWRARGGVGAFMMLARKWDRIENICKKQGYDIFEALANDKADIQDDIKDLRAYLLLVEAHCSESWVGEERRYIDLDPVIERSANPPEKYAD